MVVGGLVFRNSVPSLEDQSYNNNNNKLYALHVVLGRLASPGSPAWLCSVGTDPILRYDM